MSMIKRSQLSNGVEVLSEHVPHTQGVGLTVLVDAGPQDESEQASGLAHLCEHAFFLGTNTRNEQEIASLIDTAGGQLGGFTARDYTCLHATISSDYVTYAIDLLGDMLCNSHYTDERLHREIEVIGHEIDAHQDDSGTWLDGELKRRMWPDDTLGRSLLGTRESLSDIRLEHAQQFVSDHYTGDRVVVAAAGQVDHDSLVEQVHDSFWQLEGTDRREVSMAAKPVGGVVIEPRPQRMALTSIMIPAPAYCDRDRYALHVLVAMLGGGMSSRLYRELRERLGLAYSVSASLNAYGRGGVLAFELNTSPETVMQAVTAVFGELSQMAWADDPICEEELWKAKMQVRGQAYLSSDSIQTRVSRLATQQHYFGQPIETSTLLDEIDAVDMQTVCDVAKRTFVNGFSSSAIGVTGGVAEFQDKLINDLAELRDCFGGAARNLEVTSPN